MAVGETLMLETVKEAFPESVTVTVWAVLATPTGMEKLRAVEERVTAAFCVGGMMTFVPPPPQPAKMLKPVITKTARISSWVV